MEKTINLQPGASNILDLDFPHAYRCKVIGYYQQQSILLIQVMPDKDNPEEVFYVLFKDVYFFDGMLWWKGANLRVAAQEEHFNYMMERSLVATSQELCIFESGEHQVKLLAGAWIVILDELPERFK